MATLADADRDRFWELVRRYRAADWQRLSRYRTLPGPDDVAGELWGTAGQPMPAREVLRLPAGALLPDWRLVALREQALRLQRTAA